MYEKELRKNADETEKLAYGTDFFPFQHGDTLEAHRNILNKLNAEDLKETMRQNKLKNVDDHEKRTKKELLVKQAN